MSDQLNRCRFTSDTVGTGSSIHFVAAASTAYLTPTEAGVVDQRKYTYVITQGNDFEVQQDQIWTAAGSLLARGTPAFSKIGGTAGTTKITLDNTAVITLGASALDLMFANTRGADVASAATVDMQSVQGGLVNLTGVTGISTVTLNDGQERWALYTGAGLTITVGGSLVGNAAGANVTLATGDLVLFRGFGSSVVRFYVTRLSGKPVIGPALADITDGVGFAGCGRLTYVNGTQLKFSPYNGDKIKIAGTWYPIPSGGITAANTSVFVDGSLSSLIGSSEYLVCLFNNSGTLAFDFRSTLTHTPDTTAGNVGVEIPTGLSSRTVIGRIKTLPTTANFADSATQRLVISWFNRRTKSVQNSFSVLRTTTSASLVEVNTEIRCEFLTWGDEDVVGRLTGNANNDTATGVHVTDVVFDGSGAIDACRVDQPAANNDAAIAATKRASLSEGYHYLTLFSRRGATVSTVSYPAAVQIEAEIRG